MTIDRIFKLIMGQNFKMCRWMMLVILVGALLFPNAIFSQTGADVPSVMETEATFEEDTNPQQAHPHAMGQVESLVEKFHIKMYLDFLYEQSLGDEDEGTSLRNPENSSFSDHHTYLLVSVNPADNLRVGFDISFDEYYEIEYAITPKFFIKGGRIFLPFGDFQYHAIYGGKVYGINNDLFPNWFTDFGVAIEHNLLDTEMFNLTYGAFVSNGFREGFDGNVNMNDIGYSEDNNSEKAFGGRVKTTLFGEYALTASAMFDHWSDDGDGTLRLLALEFATTSGLASLPVLDRFNFKLGYLDNRIENDNAEDDAYKVINAFGTYAELSYKVTDRLKLTYRMGEVDPDENVDDEMDQLNYNIHGIFKVNDNLELWVMYQRNKEAAVDEIDNDYLMLKTVVYF